MGLSQQQQLKQRPHLSPEQIQVVKLIEMPNVELQARVNEELENNPMLEEGYDESADWGVAQENDYSQSDDCSDVFGSRDEDTPASDMQNAADAPEAADSVADNLDGYELPDVHEHDDNPLQNADFDYGQYVDDDYDFNDYGTYGSSVAPDDNFEAAPKELTQELSAYLMEQIGERHLTEFQQQVAQYIIGNLDSRGYLTRKPMQMVDELAFNRITVSDPEMEALVELVRTLDPIGVGAYDLKDCIRIQLLHRERTESVELALLLLEKNLEELQRHHYERLQKRLNLSDEQIQAAVKEITSCNPAPGSNFRGDVYELQRNQITPDFRVDVMGDDLIVTLVDAQVSPIRVSASYQDMLAVMEKKQKKSKEERGSIKFIKKKTEEARQFINTLRQRNETLLRTMKAIVAFQRDYFLMGDDAYLKPMILDDIAQVTGSDPSTISRVSNSKYVQTPWGIIPLKHFFSESLTNVDGEEVSTKEIKKMLRKIIDEEDKRHPYTDQRIVALLQQQGYNIARRTIAKYREQLGIPVTGQRKKMTTD